MPPPFDGGVVGGVAGGGVIGVVVGGRGVDDGRQKKRQVPPVGLGKLKPSKNWRSWTLVGAAAVKPASAERTATVAMESFIFTNV